MRLVANVSPAWGCAWFSKPTLLGFRVLLLAEPVSSREIGHAHAHVTLPNASPFLSHFCLRMRMVLPKEGVNKLHKGSMATLRVEGPN